MTHKLTHIHLDLAEDSPLPPRPVSLSSELSSWSLIIVYQLLNLDGSMFRAYRLFDSEQTAFLDDYYVL